MTDTQFQEEVLKELRDIKKQQQSIIEILSKTIDIAIGNDTFNIDEVPFTAR